MRLHLSGRWRLTVATTGADLQAKTGIAFEHEGRRIKACTIAHGRADWTLVLIGGIPPEISRPYMNTSSRRWSQRWPIDVLDFNSKHESRWFNDET
jgi:hypothetical protein